MCQKIPTSETIGVEGICQAPHIIVFWKFMIWGKKNTTKSLITPQLTAVAPPECLEFPLDSPGKRGFRV
jgi:hypothetical protein